MVTGVTTKGELLKELAPLLEYPDSCYLEVVAAAKQTLLQRCPAAGRQVEEFEDLVSNRSIEELEELYTRTFDMAPVCSPYITVHIYGDENFDRGKLMSSLSQKFIEKGFAYANELPDHLKVLLHFAPYLEMDELDELIEFCLTGPVDEMTKSLKESSNHFYYVLMAINEVVKSESFHREK